MDDNSVHCVVTSPPYYGLRAYGTDPQIWSDGWRGELGAEPTPELFIKHLTDIFREVRRVLRPDGTCWVNMGDSYATGTTAGRQDGTLNLGGGTNAARKINRIGTPEGLKTKDLIGIPWMLAFALRADGWYLRQDIIWHKPNPMPESVQDRCTKAHEYIFLLTKSAKYYYDSVAVAEPATDSTRARLNQNLSQQSGSYTPSKANGNMKAVGGDTRNRRSVWSITTKPYKGAHFATFPPDLPEICIMAGTSEKGCCSKCGTPWERVTETKTVMRGGSGAAGRTAEEVNASGKWKDVQYGKNIKLGPTNSTETLGWKPSCDCGGYYVRGIPHNRRRTTAWHWSAWAERVVEKFPSVIPCVVLDPFGGSGTTGAVALRLSREFIALELNPAYLELANKRIEAERPCTDAERTQLKLAL